MRTLNYTMASTNIVLDSIKSLCRKVGVMINLVLIAFYCYSVISTAEYLFLLIFNITLLTITSLYFIFHITTFYINNKKYKQTINKKVHKIIIWSKLFVKLLTILLSLYEMFTIGYSDLKTVLLLVVVFCFFIQLVLVIISYLMEKYIAIIKEGVMMDFEEFTNSKTVKTILKVVDVVKNPKENIIEMVAKPMDLFREEKEELEQKTPNKIQKMIIQRESLDKVKKQKKKKNKKERKKAEKKERIRKALQKFKRNK